MMGLEARAQCLQQLTWDQGIPRMLGAFYRGCQDAQQVHVASLVSVVASEVERNYQGGFRSGLGNCACLWNFDSDQVVPN